MALEEERRKSIIQRIFECSLSTSSEIYVAESGRPYKDPLHRWGRVPNPVIPIATIFPTNEDDVAKIVSCSVSCHPSFQIAVVGGGHSAWTYTSDVVLSMQNFRKVSFDQHSNRLTCGGGVLVKDVLKAAALANCVAPIGNCSDVGVLGALLGGGIGPGLGLMGLTCDNVVSLQVVQLSDGKIVVASAEENHDLFWALRGGGPGLVIVLSFVLQLYPYESVGMPDGKMVQYLMTYNSEHISALSVEYIRLEARYPHTVRDIAFTCPKLGQFVIILVLWVHDSAPVADEVARPFMEIGPVSTQMDIVDYAESVGQMGPQDSHIMVHGLTLASLCPETMEHIWAKYVECFEDLGHESTAGKVVIFHGWQMDKMRSQPADTAFPSRDMCCAINIMAPYESSENASIACNYLDRMTAALKQKASPQTTRVLLSFAARNTVSPEDIWDEERLGRLRALKAKWDPSNLMATKFAENKLGQVSGTI